MTHTAIILAGGKGTRLRDLVADRPKPMALVGNRPFLEILLAQIADKGFEKVVLCVGYMSEKISGYFGSSHLGMALHYAVENQPLGTGGAVRLAMTMCDDDHVFVFNGDTYIDIDRKAIDEFWVSRRNPIIVGYEVADCSRYGRLTVSNGLVVGFVEKGSRGPGLINGGCCILNRDQLIQFPLYQPFSLEHDFWLKAVPNLIVDLFIAKGRFIDIGVPADYVRTAHYLSNHPDANPTSPNH